MEPLSLLVFVGGLVVGIVIALLLTVRTGPEQQGTRPPTEQDRRGTRTVTERREVPIPDIGPVVCGSDGSISFEVSAPTNAEGLQLVGFFSSVVETPTTIPHAPPSDAQSHGLTTTIVYPAPPACGVVVVWAEYQGFSSRSRDYACGSCGSSNGANEFRMMGGSAPDAFPASYRLVPESAAPGAATGPGAELVGLLPKSSDTVLRFVAAASTPAEPLWRALGGPGPVFDANLVLRYRAGALGAVLTIFAVIGDRQVKRTWVASDWQFFGVNRFRSEPDEPGVPVLVVSPA